jgi:hypothetical protein
VLIFLDTGIRAWSWIVQNIIPKKVEKSEKQPEIIIFLYELHDEKTKFWRVPHSFILANIWAYTYFDYVTSWQEIRNG